MRFIALVPLVFISLVFDLVTGVPFATLMVGAVITTNLGHIDLANETPITLAEAARTLPGGAVHVSTMHRWRLKGVRGVRLETFLRGGIRYVTKEAIERFFAATTAAADGEAITATADGDSPPTPTRRQREREISQAEREAIEAGL